MITKDKIKLSVLPPIANFLHLLGFSWKTLGNTKLGSQVLIAQANTIKVPIISKADNFEPQKIVFLTMLGGHIHNLSTEITIALGLKSKGHKVTFIVDDAFYPINEFNRIGEEAKWRTINESGYRFSKKLLNKFNLETVWVSQLVNPDINENLTNYKEIIESSLLKHFKVGIISKDLPDLKNKKILIEKAVQYSVQIGKAVLAMNPDKVIMSHGIYSTWGPQFNLLRDHNIPVITYGQGKKKGTKKFNWNYTGDWWDVKNEWEKIKEIPLTEKQNKQLDTYLDSRITHKDDVLKYNFGGLEDKKKTIKRFDLDEDKITVSLFTNVLWDAASANREIAFENPIKWVLETIRWFEGQKNKQLIVKIHPAEVVIGTRQPFIDVIKSEIPILPKNVRIIEPTEEVNSWSIYEVSDLGLVHTTTAGMEMQLYGVPVIVVSKTHFRDKGFTLDINSKKEYFNTIENFEKNNADKKKLMDLSRKYAYLLFERYQIPFAPFNENGLHSTRSFRFNNIRKYIKENECFSDLLEIIETGNNFVLSEKNNG